MDLLKVYNTLQTHPGLPESSHMQQYRQEESTTRRNCNGARFHCACFARYREQAGSSAIWPEIKLLTYCSPPNLQAAPNAHLSP